MFAKDDKTAMTKEGVDSLLKAGLCSSHEAAAMAAMVMLQAKVPPAYKVMGQRNGADHPWMIVTARWDGKPVDGDVSKELADAVKPLAISYAGFVDGMFSWAVEAPTEETWVEKPDPGKAATGGGTPVTFVSPAPSQADKSA
jgi:hypothetical protein